MGNYETIDVDFEGDTYPFNYNPAHAIWQVLKMVGMPDSWIDSTSFLAAAQTLHTEGIGVSILLNRSQDSLVYIKQILSHINGVIFYGVDGKFHIRLIRDDYTVSNLPVVDVNTLMDQPTISRGSWMESYGEIRIQFNQITVPVTTEDITP